MPQNTPPSHTKSPSVSKFNFFIVCLKEFNNIIFLRVMLLSFGGEPDLTPDQRTPSGNYSTPQSQNGVKPKAILGKYLIIQQTNA